MSRRRPMLRALGVLSAVLAVVALWLVLDNPTVDDTSLGDYTCAAPYDTVLKDADNVPGGEPPPDAREVERQCIALGEVRYTQGAVSGTAAVVLAGLTMVLVVRARRRAPHVDDAQASSRAGS